MKERQRGMVDLLVFDSILVFFDTFYFTHKVIILHLLFIECGTQIVYILLPLHIIFSLSFSHLVLIFNLTCIQDRYRGKKKYYAA
jgi:hypothetical protein